MTLIGEGLGRAVFIPFLNGVAGGSAFVLGWILTAQGFGGVVGALLLARANKLARPWLLIGGSAICIGLIGAIQITFPLLPLFLATTPLTGLFVSFLFTTIYIQVQSNSPEHYRGRILGAYSTNATLLTLIGLLCANALVAFTGVRFLLYMGNVFYVLGGVVAFLLLILKPGVRQ